MLRLHPDSPRSFRARRLLVGAAVAATMLGGAAGIAQALGFLYFATVRVNAGSAASCYNIAASAMLSSGFFGIERRRSEVVGRRGGTYASITCVLTRPKATAVAMVIGDDGFETSSTRDLLRVRLANTRPAS